jgi:long-chain acyl-CoA synthetase
MSDVNLAGIMTASARRRPDHVAVKLDDAELTYGLMDEGSARVAGILRDHGIGRGDRVGVMLPNVPYFPVVYFGIVRAGAVVVPMNVLLKGREVGYYLEDSGTKLLFAWHGFAEAAASGAEKAGGVEIVSVAPGEFESLLAGTEPVRELAEVDGGDTAVILYTSGTTGQPKGAELTHDNLRRNASLSGGLYGVTEDDVLFGGLPLFHTFGQTCCMNVAAYTGATLTLLAKFEPGKALEIIQRDKVTVFAGVPTMHGALLHHPERESYDTSSLRVIISGGASIPGEVLRGVEEAFGVVLLEGYGLSETSPVASFNKPEGRKVGSIGTPVEGVDFRLVDNDFADLPEGQVGEIAIKGHNVMKGYWNRPEATDSAMHDGWFRTGDMARRDEDGYYFIVDRKKDLIIRGGFNVYPREIEEVLYEHPAVAAAAVIGVPHPTHGEEVAAAVQLLPEASVTPEELREYTKERVAAYKYPRHVWLVDALPMGPTGKILKREIVPPPGLGGS